MAKPRPHEPAPDAPAPDARWRRLTWDDLEDWAGGRSVSRGRTYQRQGRVKDLVISDDDNRLLATVTGGKRYAVSVWLEGTQRGRRAPLRSTCTCPVGSDGCKHAVAVVAEYLDRLARGENAPPADPDDPRWVKLADGGAETDEPGEEDEEAAARPGGRTSDRRRTRQDWDEKIRQHIQAKGREELAELVGSLVERFPELRDEFRERIALGEGDVDRLVAQARKELRHVTAQEAWRNNWTGEGNTPDYSKLRHRLERLVELGHADAVVPLGRELIALGIEQVATSDDEGETATELSECLPIVFDAVAKSTLTPVQKLLFAIDACLRDDYDVIGDAADVVLNAHYAPDDWSAVADDLAGRLAAKAPKPRRRPDDDDEYDDEPDNFSRNYSRDQISNWLARALEHAGRDGEVLTLYEAEARTTGSYERLVRLLIERGRDDHARCWAAEGIAKTAGTLPGIAANLAGQMCELARRHKQWDVVAAHAAHAFFENPSRKGFDQLMTAADKAGCLESVRQVAQRFLETGVPPIRLAASKTGGPRAGAHRAWPLPMPEYLVPLLRPADDPRRGATTPRRPHYDVLIDMAIADRRPDDVLHWYEQWRAAGRKTSPHPFAWFGPDATADRVAEAITRSHPERALEIYRGQADQHLTQASVSAYEAVATYLRKMRPILKSLDREGEWAHLVQQIRERYRNRPRFMEILDRLQGRPIASPRRGRR
jgi:uncharacterized Zn finger protein